MEKPILTVERVRTEYLANLKAGGHWDGKTTKLDLSDEEIQKRIDTIAARVGQAGSLSEQAIPFIISTAFAVELMAGMDIKDEHWKAYWTTIENVAAAFHIATTREDVERFTEIVKEVRQKQKEPEKKIMRDSFGNQYVIGDDGKPSPLKIQAEDVYNAYAAELMSRRKLDPPSLFRLESRAYCLLAVASERLTASELSDMEHLINREIICARLSLTAPKDFIDRLTTAADTAYKAICSSRGTTIVYHDDDTDTTKLDKIVMSHIKKRDEKEFARRRDRR